LLRLRNCPFEAVVAAHPELVCRLNLALLEGIVAGFGDEQIEAVLSPQPGLCCIAIRTGASRCEQRRAQTP
jgi:predicted ArsR family transcriptional regulator